MLLLRIEARRDLQVQMKLFSRENCFRSISRDLKGSTLRDANLSRSYFVLGGFNYYQKCNGLRQQDFKCLLRSSIVELTETGKEYHVFLTKITCHPESVSLALLPSRLSSLIDDGVFQAAWAGLSGTRTARRWVLVRELSSEVRGIVLSSFTHTAQRTTRARCVKTCESHRDNATWNTQVDR